MIAYAACSAGGTSSPPRRVAVSAASLHRHEPLQLLVEVPHHHQSRRLSPLLLRLQCRLPHPPSRRIGAPVESKFINDVLPLEGALVRRLPFRLLRPMMRLPPTSVPRIGADFAPAPTDETRAVRRLRDTKPAQRRDSLSVVDVRDHAELERGYSGQIDREALRLRRGAWRAERVLLANDVTV